MSRLSSAVRFTCAPATITTSPPAILPSRKLWYRVSGRRCRALAVTRSSGVTDPSAGISDNTPESPLFYLKYRKNLFSDASLCTCSSHLGPYSASRMPLRTLQTRGTGHDSRLAKLRLWQIERERLADAPQVKLLDKLADRWREFSLNLSPGCARQQEVIKAARNHLAKRRIALRRPLESPQRR